MGLCSRIFSLQGLIIIGAIFVGIYHKEILDYAIENYEICPRNEESTNVGEIQTTKEAPKIEIKIENNQKATSESSKELPLKRPSTPKYWLIGDNVNEALSTVSTVLERVGLQRFNGSIKSENNQDGWNLVWSTKNNVALNWKELKYHQKFNHFPWSKYLSSKSYFATTTDSKYVPKAFLEAEKLKAYAKANPKKKFLKKSKVRGGVSYVKNIKKMNFTSDDDFFVQELVENPLLFNEKLFELSVFVLITSVNPLRLYYFPKNVVPRFCPEKYDHFDFSDEDTFVVSESHVAPLDFEGTRDYFLNAYTFKDAFDGFLRKQNASAEDVWKRIEDAIRTVVVVKEKKFVEFFDNIKEMKYPYFELYSFEFIIDSSYNPHIININSNPDLSGTGKYVRFRPVYENLLYNVFQIVGIATPYVKKDFLLETVELEMMVVHANMRNVLPEFCIYECDSRCHGRCAYCMRCMNQNQFYETILAYNEQQNIGDFVRLFPPSQEYLEEVGVDAYMKSLEDRSQFQMDWYMALCKRNRKFC